MKKPEICSWTGIRAAGKLIKTFWPIRILNSIHHWILHFFPLYLQERVFLSVSNYIFTVIFVAEMTVKVNETYSI